MGNTMREHIVSVACKYCPRTSGTLIPKGLKRPRPATIVGVVIKKYSISTIVIYEVVYRDRNGTEKTEYISGNCDRFKVTNPFMKKV